MRSRARHEHLKGQAVFQVMGAAVQRCGKLSDHELGELVIRENNPLIDQQSRSHVGENDNTRGALSMSPTA